MYTPSGSADNAVIQAPLTTENNSLDVAQKNAKALNDVLLYAAVHNFTVELPNGHAFVAATNGAALSLDERHAGLTICGSGTGKSVLVPVQCDFAVNLASRLVDFKSTGSFTAGTNKVTVVGLENYEFNEVVYFWTTSSGTAHSTRQRLTITDATSNPISLSGTINAADFFKHVKGYACGGPAGADSAIPTGSMSVTLNNGSLSSRFRAGDDVLVGDGPGIDEFFGEWLVVASVDGSVITFTKPTVQSYAAVLGCVVPGYKPFAESENRQHMSDIVLQGFAIVGPGNATTNFYTSVRAGLRIAFNDVSWRPVSVHGG